MNLNFYKTCFKITAIGNVIGALAAMATMDIHLEMFYGKVEATPILTMYHYGFWAFVLVLGIAYWHLAKRPIELRILALVGALGKLTMVALWVTLFFNGHAKPTILLGIEYDAFFGVVMSIFYIATHNKEEL